MATRRYLLVFFLVLLACSFAYGEGQTESEQSERTFKFRLAHIDATGHPHHKASERLAEIVEEETDGAVQIEVYPAGQLGGAPDIMEQVQLGSIEMFQGGIGWWGSTVPDYWLVASNFVFDNTPHSLAVMNGEIGDELAEQLLAETGVHALTQGMVRNARHLIAKEKVESLDDLEGLKVRVPEMKNWMVPWEALGANPTPVPLPETYLALQQGTVDAAEHEWPQIVSNNWHEVADYATETAHQYETAGFFIAGEAFDQLPEEYQEILRQAASEAEELNNELQEEYEQEAKQEMRDEGVEFIEIDTEPWYERGREIMLEEVVPELGITEGLLERIWETEY